MRRTRRRSVALMLTLLATLAAASTALAETWKETEAAARKEGAVVLYHNFQPASAERNCTGQRALCKRIAARCEPHADGIKNE